MSNTWWCCGVERSLDQSCSCGDRYEDPNDFKKCERCESNIGLKYNYPIKIEKNKN